VPASVFPRSRPFDSDCVPATAGSALWIARSVGQVFVVLRSSTFFLQLLFSCLFDNMVIKSTLLYNYVIFCQVWDCTNSATMRAIASAVYRSWSLYQNEKRACGSGFWSRRAGRRVASIPAAGCKQRANAGHGQKTRRPEGFRAKGRLASLLLAHRSTRDMLAPRASPSSLLHENRPSFHFDTGS
jgi:hypothetical protein